MLQLSSVLFYFKSTFSLTVFRVSRELCAIIIIRDTNKRIFLSPRLQYSSGLFFSFFLLRTYTYTHFANKCRAITPFRHLLSNQREKREEKKNVSRKRLKRGCATAEGLPVLAVECHIPQRFQIWKFAQVWLATFVALRVQQGINYSSFVLYGDSTVPKFTSSKYKHEAKSWKKEK